MHTLVVTVRRAHEKVMELQRELELARNREITMHTQLSKAVLCAEKSVSERDTFAKIVSVWRSEIIIIVVTLMIIIYNYSESTITELCIHYHVLEYETK